MPIWGWVLLLPVAAVGAFVLLLFVVGLVEKIPVVQFQDQEIAVNRPDLPPYLNAMNEAVARAGFVYGGTFRHVKHGLLLVTFWFSPDRRALVQVAGGTVAKMPHRSTVMVSSAAASGRSIETRDEFTVSEMSGIVDVHTVLHASFEELWVAHHRRMSELGASGLRPFEQASPWQAMLDLERRKAEVMAERGLAKWTDPTRTAFRYTAAGALRISTVQFLGQLLKGTRQSGRTSKPRPGDRREPSGFPVTPFAPGASQPIPPGTFIPGHPVRSERDFLP